MTKAISRRAEEPSSSAPEWSCEALQRMEALLRRTPEPVGNDLPMAADDTGHTGLPPIAETGLDAAFREVGASLARSAAMLESSHQENLRQQAIIRERAREIDRGLEESRRALETLMNG